MDDDTFDTDHLYAFDEGQNITLLKPNRGEIGAPQGAIFAGTVLANHSVFLRQPVGHPHRDGYF